MTGLPILSLGAGVQSTTMALMAAHGEITPMPAAAIFADTQREGSATYLHLDWLTHALPFPVYRTSRGNLIEALLSGDDEARIPAFVEAGGLAKRQCTRNFKIRQIRRKYRELLGVGPRCRIAASAIEQWIGISLDEFERITTSGVQFITNRYPLVDLRMTRADCEHWLLGHGYSVPPKSTCVDCAFQSDRQWRDRKTHRPDEFAMAVATDHALRSPANVARFRGRLYLHHSRRPLDEVDFSRQASRQPDLFVNECDGMCGT